MAVSDRLAQFGVTIFSEMSALAVELDAINLGQGFPNWDGAGFVKEAAARSLAEGGHDQYPPSQGVLALREAIAARYGPLLGRSLDPAGEVTVTCGCTEALAASFLGLVDPGDEVILLEPFYDAYPVFVSMTGAVPRFLTLRPPSFELDLDRLGSLFTPRTKAIVLNTPNNPTGKVFSREEVEFIASLCQEFDALAITDEIYEHILYDGAEHLSLAAFEGMRERTVMISGASKTYSVTGWRVGWCLAPVALSAAIRKVHDFLTVGAPAPLQDATAAALEFPSSYYTNLAATYREKRDFLVPALEAAGFKTFAPRGAYYVMTDISAFGYSDDVSFARALVANGGVAAVPGSSFYADPKAGQQRLRFQFARRRETLEAAVERLSRLKARVRAGD